MKRLSLWAYHHKWTARILIALCYILLNISGLLAGDLLLTMEVQVSALLVYLFATVLLTALALYPSRKEKHHYRNFYGRQKTCDGILITTTFLLITSAANLRHAANTPFQFTSAQAIVPVTAHQLKAPTTEKPGKKLSIYKQIKKTLANTFQKVRNYYKSLSNAERILLLVLLIFAAGLAFMGIMAWACNLSCAGSEGAALAVAIGGVGLLAFLVVVGVRAINRTRRSQRERSTQPSPG